METYEILRTIYTAGVMLRLSKDGRLEAEGPLTDQVRDLLRTHKHALMSQLLAQRIGQRDERPWILPRVYAVPASCREPMACHRLGPCGPPWTKHQCADSP